jgi:hypothetical protein
VFNLFKQFRVLAKKRTSRSINSLRANNGGILTFFEFEKYFKEARIKRNKPQFMMLKKWSG